MYLFPFRTIICFWYLTALVNCFASISNVYKKQQGKPLALSLWGPAKWRVTLSGELRFMTPYLES